MSSSGDLAWAQLFAGLDRGDHALQVQIRLTLVSAVQSGQVSGGTRVPSSRRLATLLGASRNTIVGAYQQLIDDGVLIARTRSGIFVAETSRPAQAGTASPPSKEQIDWAARFAVQPSRLRHISKPRNWSDYPYPFLVGQVDASLFPINDWRESARAASGAASVKGWAGDLIDEDDPDLVEQLRKHVLPRRGILAAANEVIITIRAQQALSLVTRLLVGPGTPVGMEDPGYPDIRNMLMLSGGDIVAAPVDRHGARPERILEGRRSVFVTPGHHCPTTVVMPLERRLRLLDEAGRRGVTLVEDDYEADLFFEGDAEIPSLKSLDRTGGVIYVGSFSKVLAPGLRLGYVVAASPVIAELRVLRRLELRHPPTNNQRTMAMFVALGHYRAHLARIAKILAERAALIDALLARHLPSCSWGRDPGATSYWLTLPAGCNARTLCDEARERGILIEPGDIFFADPEAGRRNFRLGFTSIPASRIAAGITGLGALVAGARPDRPKRAQG